MQCVTTSGNVTYLLSILTNQTEIEIENQLMRGITPWALAETYGKREEFQAVLCESIQQSLDDMVREGAISLEQAEAFMEAYEKSYVA